MVEGKDKKQNPNFIVNYQISYLMISMFVLFPQIFC